MIIYQATKRQFVEHAFGDDIEQVVARHFRHATGHGVGLPELQSWKHSLLEMAKVLRDDGIPADAGVAIEYQLPQSSKRIDLVITGEDEAARQKVVIVELKQWSS
ncbi:MAG: AAA family ATPase, partial [Burkholderiaceae bacterium]|nr:AAA family ATPase [Burkholderiaceae bacterium]